MTLGQNINFDDAFDTNGLFQTFEDSFTGVEELSTEDLAEIEQPDLTIDKFLLEFNDLLLKYNIQEQFV